jgi:NADPH-dependent curcumin reductase CurA
MFDQTLFFFREYGARVIAAAGSDDKVQLAVSKGGPDATGFNYTGCDGKSFRSKLKEAAGSRMISTWTSLLIFP